MHSSSDLVYLAAPLFNPQERALNQHLAGLIEKTYSVFLPQRDGVLIPGAELDPCRFLQLSHRAYQADIAAIAQAKAVLAVLDGRSIDEGVAFELGFATALGKLCFGFKSDARTLLPLGDNPMIACAINRLFKSVGEVEEAVSNRLFG